MNSDNNPKGKISDENPKLNVNKMQKEFVEMTQDFDIDSSNPSDLEKKYNAFIQNSQKEISSWQESQDKQREERIKRRTKNQKIRQKRQEQMQHRRQRNQTRTQEFFKKQQEEFKAKMQELEIHRQNRVNDRKKIAQLTSTESKLQNQAILADSQNIQDQIRQHRQDLRQKRQAARKTRQNYIQDSRKDYHAETKDIQQKNWNRFTRRQKRRTERFFNFQNRLWWRGYLSLLAWILGIFLILMAIIYIFKLMGIDLLEIISTT
ncbi:MAG: hypothetical protein E4G98_04805 [Promethearchaeota archaeon]|nr:MAG: hypothetical protein E4G98_04805 [Candidatus Lokiarchaeota archaeon]